MCCCGKPTINGEPGAYSWDGLSFMTCPVNPPALADGDTLLFDEPGRCGGLDCHAYHFRLVKGASVGSVALLVRHGGGDERTGLSCVARLALPALDAMDSNGRYWLLHTLYSAHRDGADRQDAYWRRAVAERRIKLQKVRGRNAVRVSVEPESSLPLLDNAAD